MYDINTDNVKKGKNVYSLLLGISVIFLLIMVIVFVSSYLKLKSLDSQVLSTRVEIKTSVNDDNVTMYSPVYYYIVDGISYSCSSNSSSSISPGTGNKKVYYDSANPSSCMSEYSKSSDILLLIFMLIPVILIVTAIINMIKINKRVRLINKLNQHGKLVKNLPFRLENTSVTINNNHVQRVVVDYKLSDGSTITLYGDPRMDDRTWDNDGMVDLVIDENNIANYYIDFEINRLSGNLATDYYNEFNNLNNTQPNGQNLVQNQVEYLDSNNQI